MLSIRFWTIVFYIGIACAILGAIIMMVLFMKDPTFMRGAMLLTCYTGASGVGWFGGSALAKVAMPVK